MHSTLGWFLSTRLFSLQLRVLQHWILHEAPQVFDGVRGVTRLDGTWGKKQVWQPHIRSWGLSEANIVYWRKYLTLLWLFGGPRSDMAPSNSAPGELYPLPPSLRPWMGFMPGLFQSQPRTSNLILQRCLESTFDLWYGAPSCMNIEVCRHVYIQLFLKQLNVFQYFRPFLVMPEGSKYNPDRPVVQCLIMTPNHLAWDCYTVLMVYFALKLCQFGLCTCLFRAANCGFVRE